MIYLVDIPQLVSLVTGNETALTPSPQAPQPIVRLYGDFSEPETESLRSTLQQRGISVHAVDVMNEPPLLSAVYERVVHMDPPKRVSACSLPS
jgi:hypothetical protein